MKNNFIRSTAVVLILSIMCVIFAGCGKTQTAMSLGDIKISSNMFCYWMSKYKAMYLYTYLGTAQDNEQFWTQEIANGVKTGDFLHAMAVSTIMSNLVCLKLFDDYGLKLTDEQMKSIDTSIQNKISSAGGKSALNSTLSAYGVTVDMLYDIYEDELKISALQDYLYGENGIEKATDEELNNYYKENYYRCKHILVRTKTKFELDENGEAIIDEETGSYKTVELTEDEIEIRKALAEELQEKAKSGEDFDLLVDQYSEDTGMKYFEDGYYLSASCTYLPSSVVSAVMKMNIDDIAVTESSYGIHIIKRYALKGDAYKTEPYASAMFTDLQTSVNSTKKQELIGKYTEYIQMNEEIIENYPLSMCSPNFYY